MQAQYQYDEGVTEAGTRGSSRGDARSEGRFADAVAWIHAVWGPLI
jgi:hypothetical protein